MGFDEPSPLRETASTPMSENAAPATLPVPASTVVTASPRVDRYGFLQESETVESPQERTKRLEKENERVRKWQKMVQDFKKFAMSNPRTARRRIRKGVPQPVRGLVWQKLISSPATESDRQINLDLTRTFPRQVMFMQKHGQGQQSLFNVLKAYAVHDPVVGYCQGMGFIAALFLMYMTEEEAFWMLAQLMHGYGAVGMFAHGLPTVDMLLFILDKLIRKYLPRLHASFEREGIVTSMFASQWVITGFTYDYPMGFVLRVWDVFLAEGFKAVLRVSLSLLKTYEAKFLDQPLEKIMQAFKEIPQSLIGHEEDVVMETALSWSLTTKELESLERQYAASPDARQIPAGHPPLIKKDIVFKWK